MWVCKLPNPLKVVGRRQDYSAPLSMLSFSAYLGISALALHFLFYLCGVFLKYGVLNTMRKIIYLTLGLFLLLAAVGGTMVYYALFAPNINANDGKSRTLFIPTGANYQTLLDSLDKGKYLRFAPPFDYIARRMNLPNKIHPGRYQLRPQMGNRDIVNLLRSGTQTPVSVVINNLRTKEQLIQLVSDSLEVDSAAFAKLLSDTTTLDTIGFTPQNIVSVFMSDTYEFHWNTSAQQFFDRMLKEYHRFWNENRRAQADSLDLSPFEIITLAAIVEAETNQFDEMDDVAGVYLNRLHQNMPLQADPTVKFAVGDFTLKRILQKHTEFDSPYNTYKYPGLPPGPIAIPSKKAIEATLNATKHNYVFFCAKEDFSGYHNFAATYQEHLLNAKKYHDELDRREQAGQQ